MLQLRKFRPRAILAIRARKRCGTVVVPKKVLARRHTIVATSPRRHVVAELLKTLKPRPLIINFSERVIIKSIG
jgi:hypothetical protein